MREPVVDGVFYPAEADALESDIRSRLQSSSTIADRAAGLVLPHAGYTYCGELLAAGYKACAARKVNRVVIVGPCHRDPEIGIFLPESVEFRTPLGSLAVDEKAIMQALDSGKDTHLDDLPHLDEHSVEVHLPFVRYLFPQASIVPILFGRPDVRSMEALAAALSAILEKPGDGDLLVVSSNLSGSLDRKEARREAGEIIDIVMAGDWVRLVDRAAEGRYTARGAGCIAGVLKYLGGQESWETVAQGSSQAVDGDPSNCVEYATLAFGRDYVG